MKKLDSAIPRVALTPVEAAALGVGPDCFDQNIRPKLKVIRRGSKRLIPVDELRRSPEQNAERVL